MAATTERLPSPLTSLMLVGASERRWSRVGLLMVAIGYVLLHVLVVGLDRPLGWDEAVLFTQVVPDRPAVFFEPHRTRGVPLLVAPIAVFDPSMVALRGYLVIVGAAGIFAAFATWIRTIGGAAVVAAALFVTHWVTPYYAVEVLPNLPGALLAVAAGGLTVRLLLDDDSPPGVLWTLGGLYLVFALVRPPDAALIGLGTGLLVLVYRRIAALRMLLPAAVGGVVGIGVWLAEGAARFGFTPGTTMTSATEYAADGEPFNQLPLYLANLEDRLRCVGSCIEEHLADGSTWQLPPIRTSLVLVTMALATLLALLAGRETRRVTLVAFSVAVPILAFYGYSGGAVNLRYLMPAFAAAMISAATGARLVWRSVPAGRWRMAARGALLAPLMAVLVWQAAEGHRGASEPGGARYRAAALGEELQAHLDGEDCVIGTVVNYPQIQYWTGCPATRIVGRDSGEIQEPLGEFSSYVDLSAAASRGAQVLAVVPSGPPSAHPVASWELLTADVEADGEFFEIRRWRQGDPLPPPPCPEDPPQRLLAEVLSEPRCG